MTRCMGMAIAFGLGLAVSWGQGTRGDYERAGNLGKLWGGKVVRERVEPRWTPNSDSFWYRNDLADGARELVRVDAVRGQRRPAFDHAALAAALARVTGDTVEAGRLPLERVRLSPDGATLRFRAKDKDWAWTGRELRPEAEGSIAPIRLTARAEPRRDVRAGEATRVTFRNTTRGEVEMFWIEGNGNRRSYAKIKPGDSWRANTYAGHSWVAVAAGGRDLGVFEAEVDEAEAIVEEEKPIRTAETAKPRRWEARIDGDNVKAREKDGAEFALTTDGTPDCAYRGPLEWSPDGTRLVVRRVSRGTERKVYLVESSPKDQVQPKLQSYDYRKPGDAIDSEYPQLFDLAARREIVVSTNLFPNPWDIRDLRWRPDGNAFTFVYNQRGHQVMRLLSVDAKGGEVRTIIEEAPATFVDYSQKYFAHYLDKSGGVLWASERDGWNHLYLVDLATGRVKQQVTRGNWLVRDVVRVDEAERQVWFRAVGIHPEQDPYYVHLCRVNFDGSGLTVLTGGDGTHDWQFSPDERWLLDRWSRVDQPPVTELRRASDGKLMCELERADASALLAAGWKPPERFTAKGRDGTTDIFGIIVRPSNFDPAKKYPVIECIYAGPQGAFVPKEWGLQEKLRSLAELGFIVVQIDGMGTNWRSRAFHDVCWKNLADAGFPDRIAWMKSAAAKHPELDLSRVGIFGGSAGGQNALGALLTHGDFYHAAAADCGCHDNRMDKIWWNEAWMGWPIGPHYEVQSNVTLAKNLTGRLLLTVGELDHNVDPASTMQVVNALIAADKDFELIVLPGRDHGAGETPYASRRRQDFFVRHLLGVEPRR